MVEELAQHLEDRCRELMAAGAPEAEAFERTRAELDDTGLFANRNRTRAMPMFDPVPCGDAARTSLATDFWRDLRYSVRAIRRTPAFVLFVVITLGLGIGANTTVFTIVDTLLLNVLPVPDSARLTAIGAARAHSQSRSTLLPLSYLDIRDLQSMNGVFLSLAGYTKPRGVTLQNGENSQGMFCELVTTNYFSTLGLRPFRGRFFGPEEPHAAAVLNYGTWRSRFGGADSVIGRRIRLNDSIVTVIGVAPPQFIGVNAIFGPDLWVTADMSEELLPEQMRGALTDRAKTAFLGMARLRPGVTESQAQANVTEIASSLARQYPAADENRTLSVRPIRDVFFASSFGASSPVIFAGAGLLVVTGIVLLIACSNVANLLLARAAVRRQEMAVRLALGANRARLVRQLLTESTVLGILSGACGLSLSYAFLKALFGALPASANFATPKLDGTVFAFALVVSIATGLIFGIIPALHASRVTIAETLKEETRTAGRGRRRTIVAGGLLTTQVAFSFLLLVTAGLFLRSIQRAYEIDPGFQTSHLAVFAMSPGQAGYSRPQVEGFYEAVRERVAALPGIESTSWASDMPLWAAPREGLSVEGHQQRSRTDSITAVVNTVDRGYFQTAGIRIDNGREFTSADRATSTPVAIVNEKLAHDYWPEGHVLGRRIRLPGEQEMRQVVGIAATANYTAWGEPAQPCVYVPLQQNYSGAMNLYVRTAGAPEAMLMPVRRVIAGLAPNVLVGGTLAGREIIDRGLFQARMGVALLRIFGMLALGLASIGLYGLMAYSVTSRTREIGVRMALGAGQTSVLRLIIRDGMTLVVVGLFIGLTASLAVARLFARVLYGVTATDPLSIAGAAAVLVIVGLLACYIPARRASRLDPLAALRET
ncbi:MAG TPA: ABC transporter permease [Bryobacteraceae bacterium]|nr:ABC transporter permease [Bryobacteraceae bacterium]